MYNLKYIGKLPTHGRMLLPPILWNGMRLDFLAIKTPRRRAANTLCPLAYTVVLGEPPKSLMVYTEKSCKHVVVRWNRSGK